MTSQDGFSASFVETVAGFTAGIVVTNPVSVYVVDRTSSRFGGSLRIIRNIFSHEGGCAAFYRGLTPNLIGNSTSWGLYFLCYSSLKDTIRAYREEREQILTSSDYLLASGSAGVITSVLTNPIWVIKTRMLSTGSHAPGAYSSFTSGAKQIHQVEGIPGFYRGLIPALFGVSHGALQFMAYEQLKLFRFRSLNAMGSIESSHLGPERALGNVDFLVISGLSKVFAGSVTYPYQVIRSRLQTYEAHLIYRGAIDVFSQVWAQEGIAGFYKGLGPNLFRVLPSTWVTFLVYENTKVYLFRLAQNPWNTSY
ncbi:Mitochondrial substrate carrier [Penicillium camemberti]|uniref:Mitochondrial substrate carrier n=1 Tax=Penicillium camemberti (strain FM 013) TaxID=1429867 RepID=A0A0G4PVD5_PENC3|nr:Mitochondrial substrate carrier [Penicillium camemberti]